eukprot:2598215-Pyramimonas_sp.AAC.1
MCKRGGGLSSPEDETNAEQAQKRKAYNVTSQLLLIGSVLAICGLLASLLLLMFRTQCSLDDRVGMYSTLSGE